MEKTGEKFIELLQVVSRLRSPEGCSWDREQTPQSIKKYLIEEAHEVAEALDEDQPSFICEELGDLLFIIVILARIYQEEEKFTIDDVISSISEKMIRRHPHVFADVENISRSEQHQHWLAIKLKEKQAKGQSHSRFSSLPKSLPALRRAQRVSEKAAATGFDWPDLESVFAKLDEELAELKEALAEKNTDGIFEEVGDILFVLVNICRRTNVNGEDALKSATGKFINRFSQMEKLVAAENKSLAGQDEATLLGWWNRAKKV